MIRMLNFIMYIAISTGLGRRCGGTKGVQRKMLANHYPLVLSLAVLAGWRSETAGGFYMPGLRGQPLQARSGLVYEFGGRLIAEPYGGLCRPASADGQEGPSPTQAASSPPSTSTSASLLRYINVSSSGGGPRDSGLNPIGAARVEPPPSARVLDSQQPSGSGEGKAQSSGPRKSDRAIFRKIVASQRTAALAGVDTQDMIWNEMRKDAEMECRKEPLLVSYMTAAILNHKALEHAVAFNMAAKLATPSLIGTQIQALFKQCFEEDPAFKRSIRLDIAAVMDRDPACRSYLDALLYFKGFQALQTHRVAHWLWKNGRDTLAFYLQSQVNKLFQIDIHPAARIGEGVFIDHGTGIVVGETAVIGHNVSMLHMVTLGGSGRKHVDRHPKIGDGVLLGAGSTILGNVRVGAGSLVGACSLVLEDIPANSVAVGVPAKVVGSVTDVVPGQSMRQDVVVIAEDTPDYVI